MGESRGSAQSRQFNNVAYAGFLGRFDPVALQLHLARVAHGQQEEFFHSLKRCLNRFRLSKIANGNFGAKLFKGSSLFRAADKSSHRCTFGGQLFYNFTTNGTIGPRN